MINVPINVNWKNVKEKYIDPITYWRIGDLKKSFFEIGLNSKSGAIGSLTLLLSSDNSVKEEFIYSKTHLRGATNI